VAARFCYILAPSRGLGLAAAVTRLLASFLYGVSPSTRSSSPAPRPCAVASLVPARRATRVDPMVALRAE